MVDTRWAGKQLASCPPTCSMPAPCTHEARDLAGAQAWMSQHTAAGIEGVVVKDRGHGYRPGRRSWMKVRTRTTVEAIVGGVLGPLNAPEALLLGRHDEAGPAAGWPAAPGR